MRGARGLINSSKDLRLAQVPSVALYAGRLRSADLRVTRPRIAVLHSVHLNPHADTETIIEAVRACLPDVSRQAVYDILHALTDVGLLRRVQPPGSVARYETRVGDNHHHMVCRSCGAIADVDCAVGASPCLTVSDTSGFQLDGAEVIYWGRCPGCSVSQVPQAIGDHSPTEQLPPGLLSSGDSGNLPASDGQPLPTPTPTPGPGEWLAPGPLTPITGLKAAGIGTGGLGANAGWARYDIADATVASNEHPIEPSVSRPSTSI
ncbi:ferric uptake regulation protein [Mycobacterium terramassiliense]|uniref:Ferric uptake regulation protein n=1 Tax=Mycobacterium terramassiliense TaxID=1841859 RepID=A0A2U3NFZ1_9MYCO|nr:ferric uptake regulation protein [Mycobacterium terramassiliense]